MLNRISSEKPAPQFEISTTANPQLIPSPDRYDTSISSKIEGNGGVIARCFSQIANFFGRVLTAIKNALLNWTCLGECFKKEEKKEIDWAQVKATFSGIKQAVFPETKKAKEDIKTRLVNFKIYYNELPSQVKLLLHKHILMAYAYHQEGIPESKIEEYVNKNWTDLGGEFERILGDIQSWELIEAVKTLEKELEKHYTTTDSNA